MSTMKRTSRTSPPPALEPWALRFRDIPPGTWTPLTAMAIDDADRRREKSVEHRVEIARSHTTRGGARYRVTYKGETLIEAAHDPEHEACRALLARGIKGTMVTYFPFEMTPRMKVDIEKGAKLTTIENARQGPRTIRHRPHPGSLQDDDAE
jgi:hypothetical protein